MRWVATALVVVFVAASCSYTETEITPTIPANAQSSSIYAADGTLITTLHGVQNRVEVSLDTIPPIMQNAVIAIEDERFWEHGGVDVRAILRAVRENTEAGAVRQGGSTITQQLVKNTLLSNGKTLDRKIQEAALAWQLERHYSKQRILEIYLNTVYFGNGAYGVEAAAQTYFNKPVRQLDALQAATLAGVIQAPGDYDPVLHPEAATARRNVVLDQMRAQGYLTDADAQAANAQPLTLTPAPTQDRYPAAHFVEEVKKFVESDPRCTRCGSTPEERENKLFSGGLRISTTIDLGLQAVAEQAIAEAIPDLAGPEAAVVAVDPQNGYVRVMVGGRDFFGTQPTAKCNLAIGCKANPGRGTGSAFKPFVLAAALDQGIPLSERLTAPGCITLQSNGQPWHVCNADPGEGAPGGTNLVEGTVHSFNTLYAQLVQQVGAKNAVDMANKLGVAEKLTAVDAAVLGANDVTVLSMASAYGTFANRGVHVPPVLVTRITTADGTIIYEHEHNPTKAVDVGVADTVTSVLQQVIQRGTGTAAKEPFAVAGKTGTGEEYKNAWFCGYATTLATAVWVGFPLDEQTLLRPPNTSITVYGGTWPAQIWQKVMAAAYANGPPGDFNAPPPTTTTTTVPGETTTIPSDTQYAVPNVVGMRSGDAAGTLQQAGFRVALYPVATDSVNPDTVIAQSPSGGGLAPPDAIVTVEIAQATGNAVTVPNVHGMSEQSARDTLHDAGLTVTAVTKEAPTPDLKEQCGVNPPRRGLKYHRTRR